MYFPVAGIEVALWIPPLVAFCISFFTSMGGVSGAFLILPFQVSILGYTSPSVSATNQLFNIVAIPSGVYRYYREGRMVWPLTWIVIIGTLPGVFIGALIRIMYLPDPRSFKFFAGLVLLYIGLKMMNDLLRKGESNKQRNTEEEFQKQIRTYRQQNLQRTEKGLGTLPRVSVKEIHFLKIVYEFYGQVFDINTIGIFSLSFIVGIIGGIYGIGGGAIIAPFFVTFFGLPVYTVAGAALMGTFVTSVAGVAFYHSIAPFFPEMSIAPDWMLGILFGIGGMAGMYCGARLQKFIPARTIKWILVGCILIPAIKYVVQFW